LQAAVRQVVAGGVFYDAPAADLFGSLPIPAEPLARVLPPVMPPVPPPAVLPVVPVPGALALPVVTG
jgi:hypothetical protein